MAGIATFEGYNGLDELSEILMKEDLKSYAVGAAAAAAAGLAIPFVMNKIPAASNGIVAKLRQLIPAAVGLAGGYFLGRTHAAAGYALMGAGVAMSAMTLTSGFTGGLSALPNTSVDLGAWMPTPLRSDAFGGYDLQQRGGNPDFAGTESYAPGVRIVL